MTYKPWNLVVFGFVLVMLTSCSESTGDRMAHQELRDIAGDRATSCGHVPLKGDARAANECAIRAFKENRPFLVHYEVQGIDSHGVFGFLVTLPRSTGTALPHDRDREIGQRRAKEVEDQMLGKLFQHFRSPVESQGKLSQEDERKSISEMLCGELSICDVCKGGLSAQHRFAKVASVAVGSSETPGVIQLINAAKARDWQQLISFKEWKGDQDDLVTYSIACPEGGGMLAHIYDPVELHESRHLYRRETLTLEEMQTLSKFVPAETWRPI